MSQFEVVYTPPGECDCEKDLPDVFNHPQYTVIQCPHGTYWGHDKFHLWLKLAAADAKKWMED